MTSGKVGKIVAYIAIILVLIIGIGLIAKFTNGFTSDFQTFYLTVNGKDIMKDNGGYAMSPDEPLTVDVKYPFSGEEKKAYTVKVVPNTAAAETDFDFSVNGEIYSYHAVEDLASGFDIKYGENSFTLIPKGESITEILRAVYPGYEVSDCTDKEYTDMFQLIVTSDDGEKSITLGFVVTGPVSGIELDMTEIIF